MITSPTFFYLPEIQQDSLVRPQQGQSQPTLNTTILKPQLNLEWAEEVFKQFEQREQEIIESQRPVVRRKVVEKLREPSIEIDSLMAKYYYIGCSPRESFPDTITLTALERYYQPITTDFFSVTYTDSTNLTTVTEFKKTEKQSVALTEPIETPRFDTNARSIDYPSSVTLFLTLGLVLFAIIKFHFGKNVSGTFKSFLNYRQTLRRLEERRESDKQAALLSNVLFTLIAGIYISVVLPFFGISPLWENFSLTILFFTLATGLLYVIKACIWKMLGVVFMAQSFSNIYIFNMFLYNRITGLIIFPLVAVIPYVPELIMPFFVYSVLIIFALAYLFKFVRIFQIIHAQNVSVFYFILYLCTLEILPLLLFVKGCKVLSECMI